MTAGAQSRSAEARGIAARAALARIHRMLWGAPEPPPIGWGRWWYAEDGSAIRDLEVVEVEEDTWELHLRGSRIGTVDFALEDRGGPEVCTVVYDEDRMGRWSDSAGSAEALLAEVGPRLVGS